MPINLRDSTGDKMPTFDSEQEKLEFIFTCKGKGLSPDQMARGSDLLFIRSQDLLAVYHQKGSGRVLSAWEALQAFGVDLLYEAVVDGSAILVSTKEEPARTIARRRKDLGLSNADIAKYTRLSLEDIHNLEDPKRRNPIQHLEIMARCLGLDERRIGFKPGSGGDNQLAIRLRNLKSSSSHFTPGTVMKFNEAAWTIATQYRLTSWLNAGEKPFWETNFEADNTYGDASYPAWQRGYYLAGQTRRILGIGHDEPILNLRELCNKKLEIPLLQMPLSKDIAGATLANNDDRGIVVNILGSNNNVWIRRSTIAHELGHLLWDPEQNLNRLKVDHYEDFDRDPEYFLRSHDFVEMRANAFSAELLAPRDASVEEFKRTDLRHVMEKFGVSFSIARYQVWNGLKRVIHWDSLVVDDILATDDWVGRESFTVDYFRPESVPTSRKGLFAFLVVKSESANLISEDTAINYLGCSATEYHQYKDLIFDIFQ